MQEIAFENKEGKGWGYADGSQKSFYVRQSANYYTGSNFTPAPVYLLFIKYYDKKGQLMNNQFIEGGQDRLHQHYFTISNATELMTGAALADGTQTTNYIDYKYTDTTPWDKTHHSGEAKITGRSNPIGLKGAMRFLKNRVSLTCAYSSGTHSKARKIRLRATSTHSTSARLTARLSALGY